MSKARTITVLFPLRGLLEIFTRDELRDYARELGMPLGRTKGETTWYLCNSGKCRLTISLGRKS